MGENTEHAARFTGDEVRAILAGMKTQTRRPIKPRDPSWTYSAIDDGEDGVLWLYEIDDMGDYNRGASPFGVPGDTLWVRETWAHTNDYDGQYLMDGRKALYRADEEQAIIPSRWRPSIHMPRWASRITLKVTRVWVERVQDIWVWAAEFQQPPEVTR